MTNNSESLLAVIDIGSNAVRMAIYDLNHSPPIKTFNEKLFCALGRDLSTTGMLNKDGIVDAVKTIKAYALICEVQKIENILIIGTAALREAKDAQEFIAEIANDTGLNIRVISGDEEAIYAARGVLMDNPKANGIVADFGGGSLEFAVVKDNNITDTVSLQLGAYRVLSFGDNADTEIIAALKPLTYRFGGIDNFYAIGGPWRSIAASYARENYITADIPIPVTATMNFCRKIEQMSIDDLQYAYRLELPRAKLAPISAYTLRRTLEILQPKWFQMSIAGVRDGIVHEFLSKN